MKVYVRPRSKLGASEINQINEAKAREFKAPPLSPQQLKDMLFFLLLDKQNYLLATGSLITVEPIYFNNESFSVLGIGGIIANVKGKGYGRQIMLAIKDYLIKRQKSGVGFCASRNLGFYKKCSFGVSVNSIKRFCYHSGDKKITNTDDDCVIFRDSTDQFMQKVLIYPDKEVILPRRPDW